MREHSTLLMVTPSDAQGIVILEAEDKSGMIDDFDFIPPDMRSGVNVLLYPIEDYVADLMLLPNYQVNEKTLEVYRNDGVTHIALLSLPYDHTTMMFGAADFSLGFVIYYCAALNTYRLLHCTSCAGCIAGWLTDMQKEWQLNEGRGLQKARSSYH